MKTHTEDDWHEDLSHTTWADVYERQIARAESIITWFDDFDLKRGDHLLEIGSGPGYVTLQAADRVGPTGIIDAIDRSHDALLYLQGVMQTNDVTQVRPVTSDSETLGLCYPDPINVFVTYMLHHTDNPKKVLEEIHDAIPGGSRIFVCEYDPDEPGEVGPPVEKRIEATIIEEWLETTGFTITKHVRYENESYGMIAQR